MIDDFDAPNQEEFDENVAPMSSYQKFGDGFVKRLQVAIDDIPSNSEQLDNLMVTVEESFANLLRLVSSVTQIKGPATQLLTTYVDSLHKKIDLMCQHLVQVRSDSLQADEHEVLGEQKAQLEKIQDIFTALLKQFQNKRVTYHAANVLLSFILRVLSPIERNITRLATPNKRILTLNSSQELNYQLCIVANSLFHARFNDLFTKGCAILASFIEQAPNFDRQAFTKALMNPGDEKFDYSRFRILSLLYRSSDGADKELEQYLIDQTEKYVFNDNNKDAFNYGVLFQPFYASVTREIYMDKMHSNTQFCVNRSTLLFQNIEHMINSFNSKKFGFTIEWVESLSTDLISREQIFKNFDQSKKIIQAVVDQTIRQDSKDCDPTAVVQKVLKYFEDEFDKVKEQQSVDTNDKVKLLDLLCSIAAMLPTYDCSKLALTSVNFSLNSKDSFEFTPSLTSVCAKNRDIIQNLLKDKQGKIFNFHQVQLLLSLQKGQKNFFDELAEQILTKIESVNNEVVANTSYSLAMMAYVAKSGQVQKLVGSKEASKFLLTPTSQLNKVEALKRLTQNDVENHFECIKQLFQAEIKPAQRACLESVLVEYVLNSDYVFRGKYIWLALQDLQKGWSEAQLTAILQLIFTRVHKLHLSPAPKNPEDVTKQSMSVAKKIRNFLSFVVPKSIVLEKETIITILQLLSHPAVSCNRNQLKTNVQYVVKIAKMPWSYMLGEHCEFIVNHYLLERTGILSPDPTVRQIGVNVLALLGSEGLLDKVLPRMMPIFNYKPVEMLDKLETLLNSEFDKISHYDLLFYAGITRDMAGMFQEKDKVFTAKSLYQALPSSEESKEGGNGQPEIKADLDSDSDDILAQFDAPSKSKKGKKAAKGKAKAPVKPAVKAEPKQQAKQEAVPEISKEEQNSLDRQQMRNFITQMRQIKSRQIKACYDILEIVNQSDMAQRLNYQEITLAYIMNPLLKLLGLNTTRFDSVHFLEHLLNMNVHSPFFKIKGFLLSGLVAVADQKVNLRVTNDISQCLHSLNKNADFSDMGVGSLKICLTIANFVLKDPSVNLSIKEIALTVAQSILMDNSVVQMIDLVRLAINMLKTNYISNNLTGFIRKLIRRTNKIELALLIQPLLEYQPVPRKVLLTELYNYDEPLFNPVWFSTLMWILLFDEELGGLARKIFNKFNVALRFECLALELEVEHHNMFYFLRERNWGIFQLTTKAIGSAMELYCTTQKLKNIIQDLIAFYDSEWEIIDKDAQQAFEDDRFETTFEVQRGLKSDQRVNRIAVAQIFNRTAKLIQPQQFEMVLVFLITKSCQDSNDEIREASEKAALSLIKAQGEQHANDLLKVLDLFLNAPSTSLMGNDKSKQQAVTLLGHLAHFMGELANKRLIAAYDKLVDLLPGASLSVKKAITKCIPQLAKYFPDKAQEQHSKQFNKLREETDAKQLRAAAYAAAGLSKSLGMVYIKQNQLFEIVKKECFDSKKTEPIRKQAGLYWFDAMSFSMGHAFEVYLDSVIPCILSCVSDQKEPVRVAAEKALKTIMECFSNYAIKNVLPQFLSQMKNDNWRSQLSTVQALGNMAFCAPKQISAYLPQIVKGLREVLNDTHEKVHDAAIDAIRKIGSVIKCPEIGDMLEVIIKALANTNLYLNEALHLVLETSFAHAIDAPSLSLLVPLLDAGLTMHDNQAKQMSATLMGNICSLTQDPQDLIPYMGILIPAIKTSLFDAIPEIRASAAKALGRLSKGLGKAQLIEMLGWVREHLNNKDCESAEKSGAAQGFAEMISSHGKELFESYISEIIKYAQDPLPHLRESYRGVLVFLPGCFEHYVDYLSLLVPVMIEGLADETDEVRKVSMRNVKICIKQFARTSPMQLVRPVMKMMFSVDWKVRESSSILMYQLVKELENDIIKATPSYVDQETKQRILCSMFILKYDPIEKVYTQASQIWKSLIDNQAVVLRQVIDCCIQMIFQIIQSESSELQDMGLACIRGIVEKMGEKLVLRVIEIFEELLQGATERKQSLGVCRLLYSIAGSAHHRLLQIISPKLIEILDPYLSAENDDLRTVSSKVFITLFQRQTEKTFVDPILNNSFLIKLRTFTQEKRDGEAERLLETLKFMLSQAPGLKIEDRMLQLCEINDKKTVFSIAQAKIIRALCPIFAPRVFTKKFYFQALITIQEELNAPTIDNAERIQYVLMAYAELLANIPEHEAGQANEEIEAFQQNMIKLQRPGFFLDVIAHYCKNTMTNFEKLADNYLDNVLKYINCPEQEMVLKVIAAFTAILDRLPKETQMGLVPSIRRQVEICGVQTVSMLHSLERQEGNTIQHLYKKKSAHIMMFKSPAGVQAIVNQVQAAIMHGSVQTRIDAAFTLKYVLEFSDAVSIKKEIIKICGALIRVVNDKFPQELKVQIFLALKLIQQKYADSAKPMAAQLQTTFLKAIGDNLTNVHTQRVVMDNMLLLIKGLPRIDPIIKELVQLIDGTKIDGQQKEIVAECLALIIRVKGKAITSQMSDTVVTQLQEMLTQTSGLNDIVLANTAVALGYLSGYAADSSSQKALFDSFTPLGKSAVNVALKFSILTNGNDLKVDKAQLSTQLHSLLADWLQLNNGFDQQAQDEDETFRFAGALPLIIHLANTFGRREICLNQDNAHLTMLYRVINQSNALKNLISSKEVSKSNFSLLLSVLSQVPVKTAKLSAELSELVKDGFSVIQKCYLDHSDLYLQISDAILNLGQLTYDNYQQTENIRTLDRQAVKEQLNQPALDGLISEDMKLYALDIVFKKK